MKLSITLFSLVILVSCAGTSVETSRATGVTINEEGEFQNNLDYEGQIDPPGMVFVEGGTFTMGNVQDDVMMDWDHSPTQMHVASFYIDETEVTNLMYLEYLFWLKKVYNPNKKPEYRYVYEGALPDTLVWKRSLGHNDVMSEAYLRHPAYSLYPVVGVNWMQAIQFCKWRTNRVNELLLEQRGYIAEENHTQIADAEGATFDKNVYLNTPKKSFGGRIDSIQGDRRGKYDTISIYSNVSDGIILPNYRLPTEVEWEYAAGSFKGEREYNNIKGKNKYPWLEKQTRNVYFREIGRQLANFKQGKGDYGGVAGWSDDGADYTNKIKSYPPNQFGLYDMAGNVSEWVADVYRHRIDNEYSTGEDDINYFRGNMFEEPDTDESGKPIIIDKVVFDTLPNGRVMAVGLPGEQKMKAMSIKDTLMRTNFTRSNNTDIGDGDQASGKYFNKGLDISGGLSKAQQSNNRVYNSPVFSVQVDTVGEIMVLADKSLSRTTLVNNYARIYKGGSWKDMPYWLDPGQRRFLYQFLSTDDIGFRCAMSRVGSKSKRKKQKPRDRKNFFN